MSSLRSARPVAFILVQDRERARAFYEGLLGLQRVHEDEFAIVYDLAGTRLRLTTVAGYQPHPHTVLGWQVPDIVAAVRELTDRGVKFAVYPGFGQDELGIWSAPDGGGQVAWFHDPEGNNLSLTQG
jgi:catechol 2,3-dioxygenase-like lactoylglutathione lyase family enzyme